MRANIIFLIAVFVANISLGQSPEEKMAGDLVYLSLKEDVPSLEEVDRDEVVRVLREIERGNISKIGRTIVDRRGAQIALLRVGDDEALRQVVEQFRSYDSRYAWEGVPKAMEYSRQPKLIPYLSEEFFREEDPTKILRSRPQLLNPQTAGSPTEATIIVPPRSVYAGTIAMRIIMKSSSFTPEMQEWADSMIDMRINDTDSFQRSLRGWWIANKEHFEDENYKLVTSEIAEPETQKVGALPVEQAEVKAPSVDQTIEKSVPKEMPIEEPEELADNANRWLVIGIAIVAVIGIFVLLIWAFKRGRAS